MPKPKQPIEPDMLFGYWTIISESPADYPGAKRTVVARCQCGTVKSVLAQNLLNNKSQSCGCRQKQIASQFKKAYWQARGSKQRSSANDILSESQHGTFND